MSTTINNRSEIIFLYDVKDNNPNGDPLNENKPRIDEETSENYVTDVRLKRTVRDFISTFYRQEAPNKIFMMAEHKENNKLKSLKELALKYGESKQDITKNIITTCIDIRLFGGTIALPKDKKKKNQNEDGSNNSETINKSDSASIALTGPVQFRLGRSMHKVVSVENQITRTVPNEADKETGTFGYDQLLHYSLIKFYGVINENTAKCVNLTEEDVQKLLQGMWFGTKELNTRTKIGHNPRFLLKIDYKPGFFIGDLDSKLSLKKAIQDEAIRSPEDYTIQMDNLIATLATYKNNITKIGYVKHPDLNVGNSLEMLKTCCAEVTNIEHENWFNVYNLV